MLVLFQQISQRLSIVAYVIPNLGSIHRLNVLPLRVTEYKISILNPGRNYGNDYSMRIDRYSDVRTYISCLTTLRKSTIHSQFLTIFGRIIPYCPVYCVQPYPILWYPILYSYIPHHLISYLTRFHPNPLRSFNPITSHHMHCIVSHHITRG